MFNRFFILTWLFLCIFGFATLAAYQHTPGRHPFLRSTALAVSGDAVCCESRAVSLYFHPECVCSRASIAEAERVIRALPQSESIQFTAYVFSGQGLPEKPLTEAFDPEIAWVVEPDEEGLLASATGVFTSGHFVVKDATGTLLFSGGVTGSRGKQGANPNSVLFRRALKSLPGGAAPAATPVFGCPIVNL